ncbi:MAG: amino acid permease [Dysgonamonadaceae bacterium]|jgi:APA family basic amino acid/polyamine antiporter|nr:amino acid permease [Dysgonamonadaceae bacterium]
MKLFDKKDVLNGKIGVFTGISIVVANMIGTGVFTTLGFQLEKLSNTAVVLTLWVFGGLLALSGAFSYAEIGTFIRKSGGEYTFLSHCYHPLMGYLSGWISLTVGFAAPIALAAIAFTEYFPLQTPYPKMIAIVLLAIVTCFHCRNLKLSSNFQNIFTIFKILFIVFFLCIGIFVPSDGGSPIRFGQDYCTEIVSTAFAVSLIYVSYSYSGWNAAVYITEEFKNPVRALPVALIGGTLIVTVFYTLLQYTFLKHVPVSELTGCLNVGVITMERILGANAASIFGGAISLLLISGISAMVWIGSRVTASIASEYRLWRFFQQKANGVPVRALVLQGIISAFLIMTGTFKQIIIYCGVLLSISSLLVVIGIFILRYKNKQELSFRSPLFPLFQIIFILASLWMIIFAFLNETKETLLGLLNIGFGLITYAISKYKYK